MTRIPRPTQGRKIATAPWTGAYCLPERVPGCRRSMWGPLGVVSTPPTPPRSGGRERHLSPRTASRWIRQPPGGRRRPRTFHPRPSDPATAPGFEGRLARSFRHGSSTLRYPASRSQPDGDQKLGPGSEKTVGVTTRKRIGRFRRGLPGRPRVGSRGITGDHDGINLQEVRARCGPDDWEAFVGDGPRDRSSTLESLFFRMNPGRDGDRTPREEFVDDFLDCSPGIAIGEIGQWARGFAECAPESRDEQEEAGATSHRESGDR